MWLRWSVVRLHPQGPTFATTCYLATTRLASTSGAWLAWSSVPDQGGVAQRQSGGFQHRASAGSIPVSPAKFLDIHPFSHPGSRFNPLKNKAEFLEPFGTSARLIREPSSDPGGSVLGVPCSERIWGRPCRIRFG